VHCLFLSQSTRVLIVQKLGPVYSTPANGGVGYHYVSHIYLIHALCSLCSFSIFVCYFVDRVDYVRHPVKKPELHNPDPYVKPVGEMDDLTFYRKEYSSKCPALSDFCTPFIVVKTVSRCFYEPRNILLNTTRTVVVYPSDWTIVDFDFDFDFDFDSLLVIVITRQ